MPDKNPQFTVTDRRKFTLEGDLRDGETTPAEPVPNGSAAQSAHAVGVGSQPSVTDEPGVEAEEEETIPEPSAEASAQQSEDYQASTRQLDEILSQSEPGATGAAEMNFTRLVQSLYMTAAMQMGAGAAANEQPRIDILGARQSIDMLSVLEEKTTGNLTNEEKRLLQNALFDLRMSFLEITNAIAGSAQRAPQPKRR